MELKSLAQLEKSIGGRPKSGSPKIRMSFYVTPREADALKALADQNAYPISQIIRQIVRGYLAKNTLEND